MAGLRAEAAALRGELVALRRVLHRAPELGLRLPATRAAVEAALDGLGLEVTAGRELDSVTAVLRGGRPGPVVLLRADLDALPVTEATGLPYASRTPGAAHVCGHDLHAAALVGAARLLAARRAELAGGVVFMFQPGEEDGGGAELMVREGVLDAAGEGSVAAYALHVAAAQLPAGLVTTRPGPVLAACDTLRVVLRGRGGHGSSPHLALDPVPAVCEAVLALQSMVTRRIDAFDPVVLTVGSLHAGTVDNAIPERAEFAATVRSFSVAARERVLAEAVRLVRGIGAAHGLEVDTEVEPGYPVTVNDPVETAFATGVAGRLFGAGRVLELDRPLAGSEDFGVLAALVPAAYLLLGACPAGRDPAIAPFNHAPDARFDDAVLPDAAALLAALALERTSSGAVAQTSSGPVKSGGV
ncbi:M20 family metallopeptidase [Kitasatospora sp. NPDC048365]|uniref:M20 metallopeptidase family protein n=1 Tax=Kitasatospora sp. NPDC048365 TaxID=3364050 RepID=UPI0037244402